MCPIIKKKELSRNRSREDSSAGITGKNIKEATTNIFKDLKEKMIELSEQIRNLSREIATEESYK